MNIEVITDEFTLRRLVKEIKQAAKEGRIELESQDRLLNCETHAAIILETIGFSEALITDKSRFEDFPLKKSDYKRLRKLCGYNVAPDDLIVYAAERMKEK